MLPRYFLRPCLLLLLAEGPSHGYDLLDQVRRLGIHGAEAGGLYRYLRAMEREGFVDSWWERSRAGPSRRTYMLTDTGRMALRTSAESLRAVRQVLVGLLDRYDVLLNNTASTADGDGGPGPWATRDGRIDA